VATFLHTADWHLGARLVEQDRLPEQERFLEWLLDLVRSEQVDMLLVSGDIFDAANPPQEAVRLYYDFLVRLTSLPGKQAVITGGNHDSALLLNAPRELLARSGVRVVGSAPANPAELLLETADAVIASVPFLRERDLRGSIAGETAATAQEAVRAAIGDYYRRALEAAAAVAAGRAMIAMGHLTAMGGETSDSERDIHIGNLGAVSGEIFQGFHYTALGHLHRAQIVGGIDTVRYSGSPLALSFSEAGQEKSVCLFEVEGGSVHSMRRLPVPQTVPLVRARIELADLENGLLALLPEGCRAEVTVAVERLEPDLDRRVKQAAGPGRQVLKVLAELPRDETASWQQEHLPELEDLSPEEVFLERLKTSGTDDSSGELLASFRELLTLHEERRREA
jgi:exonuclease SbcD